MGEGGGKNVLFTCSCLLSMCGYGKTTQTGPPCTCQICQITCESNRYHISRSSRRTPRRPAAAHANRTASSTPGREEKLPLTAGCTLYNNPVVPSLWGSCQSNQKPGRMHWHSYATLQHLSRGETPRRRIYASPRGFRRCAEFEPLALADEQLD